MNRKVDNQSVRVWHLVSNSLLNQTFVFFFLTAQVLLKTSLYSAIAVYAVIGLLACACAWLLPVETLGLQLNQSGQTSLDSCNKTILHNG